MLLRQKAHHFVLVKIHLTGIGVPILVIVIKHAIVTAGCPILVCHRITPLSLGIVSHFERNVNMKNVDEI